MQIPHPEVVTEQTLRLFKRISQIQAYSDFYLAGGTALSLQLGHRKSIDLDFFSQKDFDPRILEYLPYPYKTLAKYPNSIDIFTENTKVFFFYYGFAHYKELLEFGDMRMLHPLDIGLTKLLALQTRSTKKDIIDLYFIDKEVIPLEDLLELFEHHYSHDSFNSYDSLTTIIDSKELEQHPLPDMLIACDWDDAYGLVSEKIAQHIHNLVSN
ncbi:nucleotidyl transferase AbiEii/AbiGii toxin family protein [Candidatus Dojkabacteria bacterium]|uniref:Nucleotidyl transferase AbiEii/AbiGii toxin family protein n=1 Tax=Candidatus Dojkabacteria bacterium TaxID=2099670 RepID=A0A955RLC0_9BACT|nr:nucleotidyl transferase AbiEii/AbiGii toxin family protein [Candidatus Dojkabacteria bacterium]